MGALREGLLTPVPRREFLKMTSLAAAGAVVLRPRSLFAAPAMVPLLSVGYADALPSAQQPSVPLVDAARALSGDPTFISRAARVSIGSFSRSTKHAAETVGAAIDAIFPAIGYAPQKYPKFQAWSYVGGSDFDTVAASTRFTVPVTGTQGLQFSVRRLGNGGGAERSPVALTLGSDNGTFKLQRGAYVIAFRESASDTVPEWSSHALTMRNGVLTIGPTIFSYVIMAIDYAS